MKYAIALLLAVTFSSCSTVQQAKKDFTNFKKTIEFNSKMPVVYNHAYYN